ncbi:MAG: creatininase family protein [Planctomycetota bacterium]|nr:MAG: creatininase family protein [Planctomycetota bacterium]
MMLKRRCRSLLLALVSVFLASAPAFSQATSPPAGDLPLRWEELTAPDFVRAVDRSSGTALIPIGVVEKHGPHLPLGTDLLDAREVALRAVKKEYSIVFPPYYFSQIFEAKHQPGTVAYSARIVWDVLQETVDEIARNGVKRIILVNGHGGNNSFLPFFCQSQLARRKDSVVYLFQPSDDPAFEARVKALMKTPADMHAGEMETSMVLAHRPDIAHPERARDQSGADQARLPGPKYAYTGIWWYARFPNHYAGEGSPATAELGNLVLDHEAEQLAAMIRSVKADTKALELQNRFYDEAKAPLKTPQ